MNRVTGIEVGAVVGAPATVRVDSQPHTGVVRIQHCVVLTHHQVQVPGMDRCLVLCPVAEGARPLVLFLLGHVANPGHIAFSLGSQLGDPGCIYRLGLRSALGLSSGLGALLGLGLGFDPVILGLGVIRKLAPIDLGRLRIGLLSGLEPVCAVTFEQGLSGQLIPHGDPPHQLIGLHQVMSGRGLGRDRSLGSFSFLRRGRRSSRTRLRC